MEKNIIALLNSNLRVIIPDFGAFIIRQKQPRVIVFNEFLRYNDGLLIDFIVRTEGIDREIADQQISDFAEESTRILESGRELTIEGLGRLYKDPTGKITFAELDVINETQEKISEEPVKTDVQQLMREADERQETVSPVTMPKPKSNVSRTKPKPAVSRAKPKPTLSTAKPKRKVKTEHKAAPNPVPEMTDFEPPVKSVEARELSASQASPLQFEPEPTVQTLAKPVQEVHEVRAVNRTNQVLTWIVVVLFANAAILAWFVFDDEIRGLFRKKAEPGVIADSVYEQLADSVRAAAMDTNIIYQQTMQEPDILHAVTNSSGARYYLVAGCFRDEINADALVTDLRGLGYKAEKFGKIGNLYAVCYASFDDKEQAVTELKRIREKLPDTWMTRF